MASSGKVVGGQFVNATIGINRKGELALTAPGFKRTPNLTEDQVASWEEVEPEPKGGAAAAIGKVGQAVSRAALPGAAGKAASAAVGSATDLVGGTIHRVRIDWIDGKQSMIQLSDKLFQHLELVLKDSRIGSALRPKDEPETDTAGPGVIGQLTQLAGVVRATPPDEAEQIAKLADLRDRGALTDEEFAARKAALLNLPAASTPATSSPAAVPPPPASPPAWAPDPHHRHQLRYWDGSVWTEHVSNDGAQSVDPI